MFIGLVVGILYFVFLGYTRSARSILIFVFICSLLVLMVVSPSLNAKAAADVGSVVFFLLILIGLDALFTLE